MLYLDKNKLPSKKFIITIAAVIGFCLLFFIIKSISLQKKNNTMLGVTVGDVVKQDANGNGIPDWQEKFLANKETSGVLTAEDINYQSANTNNYTEQFAEDIFMVLGALTQDASMGPIAQENLNQEIASFITTLNVSKTWTPEDINVVEKNTNNTQDYIKNHKLLIETYSDVLDPIPLLEQSMTTKDMAILQKITPLITESKKVLNTLATQPVPSNISSTHLELINSIQGIIDAMIGMQQYFSDPLLTFSAIFLYQESTLDFNSAIISLETQLNYSSVE